LHSCTAASATRGRTHQVKLGPIELSVQEKQTVNISAWAGVAGIVVGGVLLLYAGKRN
jgi:hypothetical protein